MIILFHAPERGLVGRVALLFLAAALAGCGQNKVEVYQVPREPAQPQGQAQAAAAMPGAQPAAPGMMPSLQWKLPAGWQEVPAGQMRLASFRVVGEGGKQADVSIIPLPGLAGRDLDNVNRWREQVGLPPVTEEEVAKVAEPLEIAGLKAQLYDQAGVAPGSGGQSRILAVVMRHEGVAWFFKMTGDEGLVGQQKPAFTEFLRSITFKTAPAVELPPSHPPIGGARGAATVPAAPRPGWQVPPGWQEVPGGQFLAAKFTIAGSGGEEAAVNVSSAIGDGGGLVGNVNRWRGQLGLDALPESEVKKLVAPLDVAGAKGMLVDMTGTDAKSAQKARVVGAVVPQAGQTWFYKLMGSEPLVEREKAGFTKFVQSAQYAGGSGVK